MKKISFLPLLALILAFAASAFTTRTVSSTAVQWEYLGSVGDEDNPSNYFLLTGSPQFECGTDDVTVCTIYAESDNGTIPHPILNSQNPMEEEATFLTEKRAAE